MVFPDNMPGKIIIRKQQYKTGEKK